MTRKQTLRRTLLILPRNSTLACCIPSRPTNTSSKVKIQIGCRAPKSGGGSITYFRLHRTQDHLPGQTIDRGWVAHTCNAGRRSCVPESCACNGQELTDPLIPDLNIRITAYADRDQVFGKSRMLIRTSGGGEMQSLLYQCQFWKLADNEILELCYELARDWCYE